MSTEKRPSNTKLVWIGILQFVLIAVLGMWCLPMVYIIFTGQRETLETALVSAVIAMVAYLPLYFQHGIRQKKKFMVEGGDPSGMNLWMFGAMGGKKWKDIESSW